MKRRAIVCFVEDKNFLLIEIFNLYKSCIVSEIYHNTDLIICSPKSIWKKLPQDPSFVIFLDSDSISNDCTSCDVFWKGYHFVNSINCLVTNRDVLSKYEYILKTDCDVFITENFLNFFPTVFQTGTGGYINNDDDVKKRLKKIAQTKGYRHQGKHDVGATWYGKSEQILESCALTMNILENILGENFKDGEGNWPGWYRGVASMYASEIAVNHLIDNFNISGLFDGKSDTEKSWRSDGVYHIHCWHTDNVYSKHAFMKGKYDMIDPNSLDFEKTNEYCLKIALSNISVLKILRNNVENFSTDSEIDISTIYRHEIQNIEHFSLYFNLQKNTEDSSEFPIGLLYITIIIAIITVIILILVLLLG